MQDKNTDMTDIVNTQNTNDTEKEDNGHSASHSSHSHSDHHSHHHKRHSASSRKSKKHKKSYLTRLQARINKKFKKKSLLILTSSVLLFVFLMFLVAYSLETNFLRSDLWDRNLVGNLSNNIQASDQTLSGNTANVPLYWESVVQEGAVKVNELQTMGGIDCVSFVWASDTHIPDNESTNTTYLGMLMHRIMNDCEIPFALITGDIGTRASYASEEDLNKSNLSIPRHLSPLWGTDRLLVAVGNHDGCFGDSDAYYAEQFSPEEIWQTYFRWQSLDFRRVFSDDGSYFYVDHPAQKIRFIVLNSNYGGEYAEDSEGLALNNRFAVSCYGQEQLDWLAMVALDMPEGYGAIIATHVPPALDNETVAPYTVDSSQIIGIINAYCNRSSFAGIYTSGVDGWSNSTVNVDFSQAKGEIIAIFAGHIHWDTVDTETLECPIITIISAGASVNSESLGIGEIPPERMIGTDTETSFDVVTINRKTRTIYCTRIGAGEDRVIHY